MGGIRYSYTFTAAFLLSARLSLIEGDIGAFEGDVNNLGYLGVDSQPYQSQQFNGFPSQPQPRNSPNNIEENQRPWLYYQNPQQPANQFNPNPQQYNPNPQQYNPNLQQYNPNSQQYNPLPQQYNPLPQQYNPQPQQYYPQPPQYKPPFGNPSVEKGFDGSFQPQVYNGQPPSYNAQPPSYNAQPELYNDPSPPVYSNNALPPVYDEQPPAYNNQPPKYYGGQDFGLQQNMGSNDYRGFDSQWLNQSPLLGAIVPPNWEPPCPVFYDYSPCGSPCPCPQYDYPVMDYPDYTSWDCLPPPPCSNPCSQIICPEPAPPPPTLPPAPPPPTQSTARPPFTTATPLNCTYGSPPFWIEMDGSDYYLSSAYPDLSWHVADAKAVRLALEGGKTRLVKIESEEERKIIAELRECFDGDVWLGGNQLAFPGQWVWTDGTPIEVDGWDPNPGQGDCMVLGSSGLWKRGDCLATNVATAFIAEKISLDTTTGRPEVSTSTASTASSAVTRPTFRTETTEEETTTDDYDDGEIVTAN